MTVFLTALLAKGLAVAILLLLRLRALMRLLPLFFKSHRKRILDAFARQEEADAASSEATVERLRITNLILYATAIRTRFPMTRSSDSY